MRFTNINLTQITPVAIGKNEVGLPIFPPPQELYDQIMVQIEPELTTTIIPTLVEKYAHEDSSDAQARAKRYAQACEKYDTSFRAYMQALRGAIKQFARSAAKSFEATVRTGERMNLQNLESAFISSSPKSTHGA